MISVCLILCLFAFASCSEPADDPGSYYDPSVNIPQDTEPQTPPASEDPIDYDGDAALKGEFADLLNKISENPAFFIEDIFAPDLNKRIWDFDVYFEYGDEIESLQANEFYITGNKIHIVPENGEIGGGMENPTDIYVFWNDNGYYTISYDSYEYFYSFNPIDDDMRLDDNNAIPVTVENFLYDPYNNIYTLDPAVAKEWFEDLVDLFDLAPVLGYDVVDDSYVLFTVQETEESLEVVMKVTDLDEKIQRDYIYFSYSKEEDLTEAELFIDTDVAEIEVGFRLRRDANMNMLYPSLSVTLDFPIVEEKISFGLSFNYSDNTIDSPYFVPSGFLRDNAMIAEKIMNNLEEIESQYSGTYYVEANERFDPCEEIHVYNRDLDCYIVFSSVGDFYYVYDRIEITCREEFCCIGEFDDEDDDLINVTGHNEDETFERDIYNKYSGAYTASSDCMMLMVYDEEFDRYILFSRKPGSNEYVFYGHSYYSCGNTCCEGSINPLINEIGVHSHSDMERLVDALEGVEFTIDGIEYSNGPLFSCYDDNSQLYYLFVIKGEKAYFACVMEENTYHAENAFVALDSHVVRFYSD